MGWWPWSVAPMGQQPLSTTNMTAVSSFDEFLLKEPKQAVSNHVQRHSKLDK